MTSALIRVRISVMRENTFYNVLFISTLRKIISKIKRSQYIKFYAYSGKHDTIRLQFLWGGGAVVVRVWLGHRWSTGINLWSMRFFLILIWFRLEPRNELILLKIWYQSEEVCICYWSCKTESWIRITWPLRWDFCENLCSQWGHLKFFTFKWIVR